MFRNAPALPLALALIVGNGFILIGTPFLLLGIVILSIFRKMALPLLVLGGAGALYTYYFLPPKIEAPQFGQALFQPKLIKKSQSPFGWNTLYEGKLYFFNADLKVSHLPCRIYSPLYGKGHKADCDYLLTGTLIPHGRTHFQFKPKTWREAEGSRRFAQKRYETKNSVRAFLKKKCRNTRVYRLFSSLCTGDLAERSLSYDFCKIGLSHILAVSGFHFSMISLFLYFLLGRFLPFRFSALFMLIMLTALFLYMGEGASITRAWIVLLVPLLAKLLDKESHALNSLCVAFIVAFLVDPLVTTGLGFQLSYLATFALLTLTDPFEKLLTYLLPIRTKERALLLSTFDKHFYIVAAYLRKGLALSLAINMTTLPLILYTFGKFPLLSFFYNLFYPLGIAATLFILLLSLLIPPLFPLAEGMGAFLVRTTTFAPQALNFYLHTPPFPAYLLIVWFALLSLLLTKIAHSGDNGRSLWRS